jgi:2-polyprenyl-3-methyl-5-hydroxy-6-metoxy-1,4-benzoquinol methylase
MTPTGPELVARYRRNYNIPEEFPLTEEMVLHHWKLERSLRDELLSSTPDTRWEVFEKCYGRLYQELDWLNEQAKPPEIAPELAYANWLDLLGAPPLRVYEVGSGSGRLVHFLATRGFECTGTEITRERGQTLIAEHPNLQWAVTDGIHLDRLEKPQSYDVVISEQVVEHIHPADLVEHFRGARAILRDGGRYAVVTPQVFTGPNDVSWVFACNRPEGMHLKEYTHGEIIAAMKEAGFRRVRAVFRVPVQHRARLGPLARPRASAVFTIYVRLLEIVMGLLPTHSLRRTASRIFRPLLFPSNVMVIGER